MHLWQNMFKISSNQATLPLCLYCDITHLSFTMGVVALHILLWRIRASEGRHQACKTVWPVNVRRVIGHYQNPVYVINKHHENIWGVVFTEKVAVLSKIPMNHINIGIKTAVSMHSPLWCKWLLHTRNCNFTHCANRGNHFCDSFHHKSMQSCYDFN